MIIVILLMVAKSYVLISREDISQMETKLMFRNNINHMQDTLDILDVKVDSFLRFDRHIYNGKVRLVMEYVPVT